MMNLFPDDTAKSEGAPENIDYALYEALSTRLLDLHAGLDDGTEHSVMGRLNRKILNNEPIDATLMKVLIRNIDREISAIHAQICLATRQAKKSS